MKGRCPAHDYSAPGIYHITFEVTESLGQPLGRVVGDIHQEDGQPNAPRVELSPVGQMVKEELLKSIPTHYPMVEVQDYVIMPEHMHFIIEVHSPLVSRNGKTMPLGQVIGGFKKGCNRHYWALTHQEANQGKPDASNAYSPAPSAGAGFASPAGVGFAPSVGGGPLAVSPQAPTPQAPSKIPSSASTGRTPLFAYGFTDVMPLRRGQLDRQRRYIRQNPRSRLLRSSNPAWLKAQRGGIDTALTFSALCGYLKRECPPSLCTPEVFTAIQNQLLMAERKITCDTYGDRSLLAHRLLPVICHRKDAARFSEQKVRCLAEADNGAILVSPRIAKGEQEIIDEAVSRRFPVVLIPDNGFAERFHPSEERLKLCAEGRLLLVTPWQYQYRPKKETISVPFCKTMNCVAQALCRLKDNWWKDASSASPVPTVLISQSVASQSPASTVPSASPAGKNK